MDRRSFVKNASATAGLAVLAPLGIHAISAVGSDRKITVTSGKKRISDKIVLGNTGIEVSRMAMGTGSNGWNGNSNQTRQLGIKGLADLLQLAFDKGVYFWDSADQYGTHPHLKEALKRVPREKIVIMSKTRASSEEEMHADLDRFRKEIGTDYIDIILLHCMTNKNWPDHKKGAMNVLSEAKQKKIIRAHGVSCHTLESLQSASDSPWVEIDLARINPAGASMDADVKTVEGILRQMKQSGKVIMGMKIFGNGKLVNRKDECIRYALAQDYLSCFTVGIENQDQLVDMETRLPALS